MYEKRVLIETYWNVNLRQPKTSACVSFVLIETYWNVNEKSVLKSLPETFVLIETYWNVNQFPHLTGQI